MIVIAALLLIIQLVSVAVVMVRLSKPPLNAEYRTGDDVCIVRPLCGVEYRAWELIRSGLVLRWPMYRTLLCVSHSSDPAVLTAREAIWRRDRAEILVGDNHKWPNPKLSNIEKGWLNVTERYVAFVDSNVELPANYLNEAVGTLRAEGKAPVGMVSSPPAGSDPRNFWAKLECAFLNTYQARWQLLTDTLGIGFAQGKNLVFETSMLRAMGGLEFLASEPAEDAAATRMVRKSGLRVALLNRPTLQPLGNRRFRDVWNRQVRWARLRRATFASYFFPELFVGFAPALIALLLSGVSWHVVLWFFITWYGAEVVLAVKARWHVSIGYVIACVIRDLLLPAVWVAGWGRNFVWRGNEMTTRDS